ncbi:MAG: VOC family protein [Nocardioides sp.]
MTLATFKDLCIDAVDPENLGAFWAGALGLAAESLEGEVKLTGSRPEQTIWICQVPEPVTVKQRVHLDIHAASVDDVLALGATPLDIDSFRWKVVRDPEGGELCVFERTEVPAERIYEVVVDCVDAQAVGEWWGRVLGVPAEGEDGWWGLEGIAGAPFEYLVFGPVPEPKTVKNRIHWDVYGSVEELVAAGASVVRAQDDEIRWTVMADPEGNEFCVFAPRS